MSEQTRKSIIHKTITRKLSTAKFESLDLTVEFEEEVEWNSIKERQEKSDKITKLLLVDYTKTRNAVLDVLGLTEKKASVSSTVTTKSKEYNVQELGLDDLK